MQHITDCKKIDFKKLSEFKIPEFLAKAFEIITLGNIHEMFSIPKFASKENTGSPDQIGLLL